MKTIRLKESYRGKRTQERVIPAGDYADDDKRLFGIADYLVENGHAVYIKSKDAVEVEVNADTFPDLTPAEVAEIRARYALALRLNAQWDAAKTAHANAADPLQGEDIYHSDSSILTVADDLLTLPGKGVVPDIKVSRAAWAAGENVVFPAVATGGEVLVINEEDAVPWDEVPARWQDSDEYRNLERERATALMDAQGEEKQREVAADFDTRRTEAESKWNEVNVRPVSKPTKNVVKGKQK